MGVVYMQFAIVLVQLSPATRKEYIIVVNFCCYILFLLCVNYFVLIYASLIVFSALSVSIVVYVPCT
jgi:hypothetical protein